LQFQGHCERADDNEKRSGKQFLKSFIANTAIRSPAQIAITG
jgi:hypothetical protein